MKTFYILFAATLSMVLVAGCDPGLPEDSVSSLVQTSISGAPQPKDGCGDVTDVAGAVWTAVPVVGQPGLVLMQRDGEAVCFDTADSLAAQAAKLKVRLVLVPTVTPATQPPPPTVDAPQSPETLITDDPIPVGGTRVATLTPTK
jgi:hypothetical protein